MLFNTISCINKVGAIGKDNQLLYHIKNDMENFKSLTTGNVVIMGQKTLESLPKSAPLKNRINIVITDDENFCVDKDNIPESSELYIVHSIDDAIELCLDFHNDLDAFVIGGASMYRQFIELGMIDRQYLTIVSEDDEGDAYYPEGYDNPDEWRVLYHSLAQRDSKSNLSFVFKVLERK